MLECATKKEADSLSHVGREPVKTVSVSVSKLCGCQKRPEPGQNWCRRGQLAGSPLSPEGHSKSWGERGGSQPASKLQSNKQKRYPRALTAIDRLPYQCGGTGRLKSTRGPQNLAGAARFAHPATHSTAPQAAPRLASPPGRKEERRRRRVRRGVGGGGRTKQNDGRARHSKT